MLTCSEVSRLIASGEIERSGRLKRFAVRLHLVLCLHCRRYAAQLRQVAALVRRAWGPHPGDPATLEALEARILSGLWNRGDSG